MPLVAPHHVVPRRNPPVVHLESAVPEPGDEDVAGDLVAGESCQARVGARRKVLCAALAWNKGGRGRAHLESHLARSVPDADVLDVPAEKDLPASLLPLQNEAGVCFSCRSRDRLLDPLEGRDEADAGFGFVVAEKADVTVSCEVEGQLEVEERTGTRKTDRRR